MLDVKRIRLAVPRRNWALCNAVGPVLVAFSKLPDPVPMDRRSGKVSAFSRHYGPHNVPVVLEIVVDVDLNIIAPVYDDESAINCIAPLAR